MRIYFEPHMIDDSDCRLHFRAVADLDSRGFESEASSPNSTPATDGREVLSMQSLSE
jgi:hypothetical protein